VAHKKFFADDDDDDDELPTYEVGRWLWNIDTHVPNRTMTTPRILECSGTQPLWDRGPAVEKHCPNLKIHRSSNLRSQGDNRVPGSIRNLTLWQTRTQGRYPSSRLYGVIFQTTAISMFIAFRTPNLIRFK
jgi:hypothetical protein